jgi:hypothetical protein
MAGTLAADRHPTALMKKPGRHCLAVIKVYVPAVAVILKHCPHHTGAELDVRPKVEAVGDVLQVAQDLWLFGVLAAPDPLLLKLFRK